MGNDVVGSVEWPYQSHDPKHADAPEYGGDICPWCGWPLRFNEVTIRASDCRLGTVRTLAPNSLVPPLLHPQCHREARKENPDLLRYERCGKSLEELFGDGDRGNGE